jgi:hypothetical protein
MKLVSWIFWVAALAACGTPGARNHGDDTAPDGGGGSDGSGSDGGNGGACAGEELPAWLPVGQGPTKLVAGDFNRDGIVDLATLNIADRTVSVLLGIGGGRFAQAIDYPASDEGFAVSDVDRDGKLDLIVLEDNGDVAVMGGNDDGSFQSPAVAAHLPSTASAVGAGDFDGDGAPDIAVANGDVMTVLRGSGTGTFSTPATYAIGYGTYEIAVTDVDRDGTLDLVASGYDGVDVFRGNGDGTFQSKLSYTEDGYSGAVGDVTGDGIADLVVPQADQARVALLPGTGAGSFGTPVAIATQGDDDYARVTAIGDVDGDGKPDVIVGGDATTWIVHGHGDGTFDPPQAYPSGGSARAIIATDLSGDGIADVALASTASGVVTLWLGAAGGVPAPREFPTAHGPTALALADIDGDHKLDAFVLDGTAASVSVLLGAGAGTFTAKHDAATGTLPHTLAIADFDGDGIPDAATANQTANSVSVLRGHHDGTLAARLDTTAGIMNPTAVVAADFTSDGKPDLVVANGSDQRALQVLVGNGDGTFTAGARISLGTEIAQLVAADLDGNGQLDVVAATGPYGYVEVFPSNGDGTFQSPFAYGVSYGAPSVGTGDFDGDGHLDVAVVSSSTTVSPGYRGYVAVLHGNGDGTLGAPAYYAAGWQPEAIAIGDLDGDGKLDCAVADVANNSTSVLRGNGDGTFKPMEVHAAGASPTGVAIGDIDGDGKPDVVTANFGADAIGVARAACMH